MRLRVGGQFTVLSDEWAKAGKRHDTDDGGHWHEPNYPSCVVCRMRDLEQENASLRMTQNEMALASKLGRERAEKAERELEYAESRADGQEARIRHVAYGDKSFHETWPALPDPNKALEERVAELEREREEWPIRGRMMTDEEWGMEP